jgi:peptide chain release factor 1
MEVQIWDRIASRYEELNQRLVSPALEPNERHVLQKELSLLKTLLEKKQYLDSLKIEKDDAQSLIASTDDAAFKQLAQEELAEIEAKIKDAEITLEDLLYPADELNERDAFIEIRAGTGGQEAALFVGDLLRMYLMYATKKNWKASIVSESPTDLGGYREVILHVVGKNVFGHLKFESGVHRVQRVPKTETSGRIHTSTATVAVLPEAEEVELSVNPADLRIDVYRSGGAGGQHVNTTDSAVRITHIPTGLVVTCQDERSQHKNKAKALKVLQSRLLQQQRERQEAEMSQKRKELVGSGMRAEKTRTYNFPQNRVTDHLADVTLKNLDMVMEGELDDIIDALMTKEREDRKKHSSLLGSLS